MASIRCVTVFKISGTDPEKEEQMTQYLFTEENPNRLNSIIDDIRSTINDWYTGLFDWENSIPFNYHKDRFDIFSNLISIDDLDQRLENNQFEADYHIYQKFNEPPEASLFFVENYTSYNFHYYIEISSFENWKMETIIHDH